VLRLGRARVVEEEVAMVMVVAVVEEVTDAAATEGATAVVGVGGSVAADNQV